MKTTFQIKSSNKKNWLMVSVWEPEGEIRAILQIAHGMKEYMGRYDEFAEFLNEQGILVVGNDHLGHGYSVNTLDELGYFPCSGQKNGAETAVADLYRVTGIIKSRYAGKPYFLLGHSMGSFFVRQYLMQYGDELDGAILMATGRMPKAAVKAGKEVLKTMKRCCGDTYKSRKMNNAMNVVFNQKFQPAKTKSDWISRDEKKVQEYIRDPRCNYDFTLNGFQTLLDTITFIQKEENIRNIPNSLPILFLSGGEDPLGEEGKGVKAIYRQYKRLGMRNMKLKLYPGARHEILNELDRQKVYGDIARWLKMQF